MDLDVKVAALTGVIDVGMPLATQARPSCETAEIAARTATLNSWIHELFPSSCCCA
jgi:hypothetical protein